MAKILIYRYNSICEEDIITAFRELNIDVEEICDEMTDKRITSSRRVELVKNAIEAHAPVFVFSINFFPAIAEICHIYHMPYLCWSVDSPVLELFSDSIKYDTNRVFLFDRAQYEDFARFNPDCIFHLPLAAAVDRFDRVINSSAASKFSDFSSDISFVGSLYSEKSPLEKLKLPDFVSGYIDGVAEAALKVYGYNFTQEVMTDECVRAIKRAAADFYSPKDSMVNPDRYVAAHSYVGMKIANIERIRTLNILAQYFNVDLFTRSDISPLVNVKVHGGVRTLDEMPLIFNKSRINLNMTIKPIQKGLPLRIFDILGCGGFCMTNYQEELGELFEIGVDLEVYSSMEELVDKCAYYLEHEDERRQIALNGCKKVKENYTYKHRIMEMLKKTV